MFATRLDKLLDHMKASLRQSRSKICNGVITSHGHLTWQRPRRVRRQWRTEMGWQLVESHLRYPSDPYWWWGRVNVNPVMAHKGAFRRCWMTMWECLVKVNISVLQQCQHQLRWSVCCNIRCGWIDPPK